MVSDSSTHPSLLSRVRDPSDEAAWREFDARYGDLIVRYCRSRGLQYSDAEDIRQMVMFGLSKSLRQFQYSSQRGRFRSYLGQVVRRALSHFFQSARPHSKTVPLDIFEVQTKAGELQPEHDSLWDAEWVKHHYRLAMRTVRATYEPRSVEVFERLLAGQSVAEIAEAFTMSQAAVHKVKQRIRDRIRELIAAQIRDEQHNGDVA